MKINDKQAARIRWVAGKSDSYVRDLRAHSATSVLTADWWMAMRFWFSHAFYQGRSDKVSKKFEDAALKVLDGVIGPQHDLERLAGLDLSAGGQLEIALQAGGLPKGGDRHLVAGSLALARDLPQGNITKWSVEAIHNGDIDSVYIRLDEIRSIGDKIITFYLRDLDFLFDFHLDAADFILLQPIDTWVRQLSEKIGLVSPSEAEYWVKRAVVKACLAAGVKPSLYNVGAWWVGSHGLQLPN